MRRRIQISRYRRDTSQRAAILALLAESVGSSTKSQLEELIDSCRREVYPALWIASRSDRPIGVMRLDAQDQSLCMITHIAVDKNLRGRGVGRKLIEFIHDDLDIKQAWAETDDDAVGFYETCGFEIEPLGMNKFGVQRYKCTIVF